MSVDLDELFGTRDDDLDDEQLVHPIPSANQRKSLARSRPTVHSSAAVSISSPVVRNSRPQSVLTSKDLNVMDADQLAQLASPARSSLGAPQSASSSAPSVTSPIPPSSSSSTSAPAAASPARESTFARLAKQRFGSGAAVKATTAVFQRNPKASESPQMPVASTDSAPSRSVPVALNSPRPSIGFDEPLVEAPIASPVNANIPKSTKKPPKSAEKPVDKISESRRQKSPEPPAPKSKSAKSKSSASASERAPPPPASQSKKSKSNQSKKPAASEKTVVPEKPNFPLVKSSNKSKRNPKPAPEPVVIEMNDTEDSESEPVRAPAKSTTASVPKKRPAAVKSVSPVSSSDADSAGDREDEDEEGLRASTQRRIRRRGTIGVILDARDNGMIDEIDRIDQERADRKESPAAAPAASEPKKRRQKGAPLPSGLASAPEQMLLPSLYRDRSPEKRRIKPPMRRYALETQHMHLSKRTGVESVEERRPRLKDDLDAWIEERIREQSQRKRKKPSTDKKSSSKRAGDKKKKSAADELDEDDGKRPVKRARIDDSDDDEGGMPALSARSPFGETLINLRQKDVGGAEYFTEKKLQIAYRRPTQEAVLDCGVPEQEAPMCTCVVLFFAC